MKILTIKDISRKDVPIYYRMFYTGIAAIELMNAQQIERHIDFSIEMKPTGQKEIIVTLAEPIDYPLVPVVREIKAHIHRLDDNGELPL